MNPLADADAACLGIAAADDGGVRARFAFPADLAVFRGHFPGRPLLPGVHQAAAVAVAVGRALGRPLRICAIPRCKWSAMVGPGEVLAVDARWSVLADGRIQADGTLARTTAGAATACTCRLLLAGR